MYKNFNFDVFFFNPLVSFALGVTFKSLLLTSALKIYTEISFKSLTFLFLLEVCDLTQALFLLGCVQISSLLEPALAIGVFLGICLFYIGSNLLAYKYLLYSLFTPGELIAVYLFLLLTLSL